MDTLILTIDYGDARLPARFWERVYPCPVTGCWLWGGAGVPKGYGVIRWEGRQTYTHRVVALVLGVGGSGPVVDHWWCDNPPCVNPTHLRWSTQRDNVRRGRAGQLHAARMAAAETCSSGLHPWASETTKVRTRKDGSTYRICLLCRRAAERARRAA